MKTKLYRCSKRNFGVIVTNYCDWFEKKRSTLSKRCCKNCRYFTDEQVKDINKKKNTGSKKKSAETETKEQKE